MDLTYKDIKYDLDDGWHYLENYVILNRHRRSSEEEYYTVVFIKNNKILKADGIWKDNHNSVSSLMDAIKKGKVESLDFVENKAIKSLYDMYDQNIYNSAYKIFPRLPARPLDLDSMYELDL